MERTSVQMGEEGFQDDQDGRVEDDDWAEHHAKTRDSHYISNIRNIHLFITAATDYKIRNSSTEIFEQ